MDAARRVFPPQDGSLYAVQARERFDRRLGRPQLAAIGISGTLGIGLFITSGELIGIVGTLGTFLAYIIASLIAACVMYTMAEMVSARPVSGAIVDFPNTFVSGELGFATGAIYWIAQSLCMATLNASTARVADSFSADGLDPGQRCGLIFGLVVVTALSNLIGVSKYGQLERIVAIFKLALIALLAVLSIAIIFGLGGLRNQGEDNTVLHLQQHSNGTRFGITPGFTPDGYRGLLEYNNLTANRTEADLYGISGNHGGRLFALLTATALAMFSCMGGDQVIMTAGEAKDPWNDLPAVTKLIYTIPLTIYPMLSLLVGFAINYADPHLYRPWAMDNLNGSHSPFIIAIKYASLGSLPTVLNACFMIAAYTCGNTSLYISSRTLFVICQNYGTPRLRKFFARTSANHTPQTAIIFSSLFGFLGLLGLADKTFNQPVLTMSAFFTGAIGCVYISECWTFLKFKKGLDIMHSRRSFSRDHELYRRYLFRGHWQPFIAYCGLIGTGSIVIFSGIPSIWLLCNRDRLASKNNLKSAGLIATDLVGAYSGPVLFAALYFSRKWFYGSEPRDPESFLITAYVIPDTSLFPARQGRGVNGSAVEADIEKHLKGHGRVFSLARDGTLRRGRGFWTELSMFIVDRNFKDSREDGGEDGG